MESAILYLCEKYDHLHHGFEWPLPTHILCAPAIFRHYLLNSTRAQPHTIKALCKRCVNLVPTPFIQVARRMVLLQFAVFAA